MHHWWLIRLGRLCLAVFAAIAGSSPLLPATWCQEASPAVPAYVEQQRMENIGVTSMLGEAVSAGSGLACGYPMGANFASALTSPSTFLGLAEVAGSALRRGHQVIIPAGQNFQFQLDTALSIPALDSAPQTAAGYRWGAIERRLLPLLRVSGYLDSSLNFPRPAIRLL